MNKPQADEFYAEAKNQAELKLLLKSGIYKSLFSAGLISSANLNELLDKLRELRA